MTERPGGRAAAQELCFRSLDLYSAATLEHGLRPPVAPKPEWRQVMAEMSVVACDQARRTASRRLGAEALVARKLGACRSPPT